ncbi:hypothetical protein [Brachybacterium sp.]|uniref:hypothetical protein n=1 Tax=Brachybacterium sp. TaxID=1891286 RepID=UPI002ECFB14A
MTHDPSGQGTGEGSVPGRAEMVPAVVLFSAPWAGPSRPAPTVLRELARRWGSTTHALLFEDPSEKDLDRWGVDVLPTWFRLLPADTAWTGVEPKAAATASDGQAGLGDATAPESTAGTPQSLILSELSGHGPDGAEVHLPGPWTVVHRREGAQPKHVVDTEFGPNA